MKKFNIILLLITLFAFNGCQKKSSNGVEQIHWDRDVCARCVMAISDRKFAAEIVNPKTKKAYKFDDIGCAVLWLKENKIPWSDSAKIFVKDGKSGKWVDARSAKYTNDAISPMGYGFKAFSLKNAPKDKKLYNFDYVQKKIIKIENMNNQKVGKQ